MRKIILLFVCFTVFGCKNEKSANQRILSDSSGNINNLSVIIENDLWQGNVGEAIRNVLASPVDGLPQDEPLFSMSQLPPQVFTGFATHNRIVLKIEKGKASNFRIALNISSGDWYRSFGSFEMDFMTIDSSSGGISAL